MSPQEWEERSRIAMALDMLICIASSQASDDRIPQKVQPSRLPDGDQPIRQAWVRRAA